MMPMSMGTTMVTAVLMAIPASGWPSLLGLKSVYLNFIASSSVATVMLRTRDRRLMAATVASSAAAISLPAGALGLLPAGLISAMARKSSGTALSSFLAIFLNSGPRVTLVTGPP